MPLSNASCQLLSIVPGCLMGLLDLQRIDYFRGSRPNCIEKAILKDITSQMPGQITALQNQEEKKTKLSYDQHNRYKKKTMRLVEPANPLEAGTW